MGYTRKELFERVIGMKLMLDGAAAMIQNPVEEMTWDQVEECRAELATIGNRIQAYTSSIDDYITDNTPIWAEQWDLANILYAPYLDPDNKYDPKDIDTDHLAKEFEAKGLCKGLAAAMAKVVKYPNLG